MYVAFWMLSEINHQRVGMYHRRIQIVIESGVTHEQSEGALVAVQLGRHLLHIPQGIVHPVHRRGEIQLAQIPRQVVGIGQHPVGILQHLRHLLVQTGRQTVQFT